jgi:hypothetical protein
VISCITRPDSGYCLFRDTGFDNGAAGAAARVRKGFEMRSIKTTVTAAATVTAGFVLTAPAPTPRPPRRAGTRAEPRWPPRTAPARASTPVSSNGVGILGAAGAGALVLRRRRAGSES